MVPLSAQLNTPVACGAILLYAALILAPFVLLWRAPRKVCWLALGFAIVAVLVRLPEMGSTPPGVNSDDVGVLLALSDHDSWTWQRMVGEGPVSGGSGWCNLPWYVTYRLTESLWAMRIDGTAWNAALCVYAVIFASRFFPLGGAALTAAILTFTPWSLWLSRHAWGPEIILQQLYLLAAIEALRTRPGWRGAFVCGLMMVLLQHTYLAARISVILPVALLIAGPFPTSPLRTAVFLVLAYGLAGLGMWPHIATQPTETWMSGTMAAYDSNWHDWVYMLRKAGVVLGSLGAQQYSTTGTNALRGAQTLSPAVLAIVLLGALASITGVGRAWLVAALIGIIPSWISQSPAGNSHRMMMMLAPIALLAGAAPRLVPLRLRTPTAAAVVALIAVTGLSTWFSPAFWQPVQELGMMAWALPFRAAVQQELERQPPQTVRMQPGEDGARLLARERNMTSMALDLETNDFANPEPLAIIWRNLDASLLDLFEQEAARGTVTVEHLDKLITVTRLPHGLQGLVGDPPRRGWNFSADCAGPPEHIHREFVTPILFEGFVMPPGRGPCTYRWRGRATERLVNPILETDLISDGTVRIDDKPIQRTDYVTTLPTIEPGQQVEIVLQGKDGPIRAFLRPKEVAAKAGAAHDRLAWGAVIPLEPPR